MLWTRQRQAATTRSIEKKRFMVSSCGSLVGQFENPRIEVVSKEEEAYESSIADTRDSIIASDLPSLL